jgi:hypothetical protein
MGPIPAADCRGRLQALPGREAPEGPYWAFTSIFFPRASGRLAISMVRTP